MDPEPMDYVMHPELPSTPQAHHPPRGCPAWRHDHGAYLPSPHGMLSPTRNPHSPYDPVHGSSGGWFPQPPFQWSPPTGPSAQPRSAHSDPYFNSMSAGLGGPAGPMQPGFLPIPQYSAPLDPFGPLHFHHRPSHQRAGGPNLPNLPNPVSQPGSQPSQSSFAPERHNQASTPRSVGLPSVNFSLPQLQPPSQPNMSTAGDSSSSSSSTPERRPTFTAAPDSPRGPSRSNGLFTASPLSLRSLSSHRHEAASQSARPLSQYAEPPVASSDPTPPVPSNTERARRIPPSRHREIRMSVFSPNSDDSDDELEHFHERVLEQYSSGATPYPIRIGDMGERHVRAHQLLRGQMSSKRVASKSAISSLQSVEIDTLPESERTCVICYNEFGVPNPEGINEAPLRLPKCKHVFGDHCIKKWFEESDSCPYCRDKVPSEPQVRATPEAIRSFFRHAHQAHRVATENMNPAQRNDEWPRGGGSAEVYATLLNHRNVLNIDVGSTSSRVTFHPVERRSPPDDSNDSRRRTRARHGSLRGSPSSAAGGGSASSSAGNNNNNGAANNGNRPNSFAGSSSTSHQQSPARERFVPPHLQNLWNHSSHQNGPVRRSVTPHIPRQYTPGWNQTHRTHASAHPRHPSGPASMTPFSPLSFEPSPHAPPFLPGPPTFGTMGQSENQPPSSGSLNNSSASGSQAESGQHIFGSSHTFGSSQHLPPVGGDGPSGPGFQGMSGHLGGQMGY